MNNPKQRYFIHLDKFKNSLDSSIVLNKKNKLVNPGTALYDNDGRTPFFQLQGLARIDSKIGKGKQRERAEDWLISFKELEDALGKYDYWVVMLEKNKKWNFPNQFVDYFNMQMHFQLGVLEERLLKSGWLRKEINDYYYDDTAFSNFKKSIQKNEHYGPEKERKKLLIMFRDEVNEIHEKVKSKEIDLDQVEWGIHEFRRKIRWISIYCSALLGKVRLKQNSNKSPLNDFVTKENMEYKFNQLPYHKTQDSPVFCLQGGFYAMSNLIKTIGDIKDPALATEEILSISNLLGYDKKLAIQHLGNDYYPHSKVVKDAKNVIDTYLFKNEILLNIADYFDKQLN